MPIQTRPGAGGGINFESGISEYQEFSSVPPNTLSEIFNLTVLGDSIELLSVNIESNAAGVWDLKLNGVKFEKIRTTGSVLSREVSLWNKEIVKDDVLTIDFEHSWKSSAVGTVTLYYK